MGVRTTEPNRGGPVQPRWIQWKQAIESPSPFLPDFDAPSGGSTAPSGGSEHDPSHASVLQARSLVTEVSLIHKKSFAEGVLVHNLPKVEERKARPPIPSRDNSSSTSAQLQDFPRRNVNKKAPVAPAAGGRSSMNSPARSQLQGSRNATEMPSDGASRPLITSPLPSPTTYSGGVLISRTNQDEAVCTGLLHAPSRVTEATSTAPLVSPARRYTSSSEEADAFLASLPLQPSRVMEVTFPLTATESSVSSTGSGKRKAEGEDGPAAKRSRMRAFFPFHRLKLEARAGKDVHLNEQIIGSINTTTSIFAADIFRGGPSSFRHLLTSLPTHKQKRGGGPNTGETSSESELTQRDVMMVLRRARVNTTSACRNDFIGREFSDEKLCCGMPT
ncbi:hypothetical protein IWX50DRAFT_619907 [Phyllosticta citricarpa]